MDVNVRVKTADDTCDGSSGDAEDELAVDAARLEQTRDILREVGNWRRGLDTRQTSFVGYYFLQDPNGGGR